MKGEVLVGWSRLSDRWAAAVAAAGERTFLEHAPTGGEVVAWTYREFDAVVDRVRRALAARGLRPGAPGRAGASGARRLRTRAG